MSELVRKYELKHNADYELDLTTASKSDLSVLTKNVSPNSSLSNGDVPSSSSTNALIDNIEIPDPIKNKTEDNISEQEIQDALERSDVQQQVRASIVSLPPDLFIPQIKISRKRSWIGSKLPFLNKSIKSEELANRSLNIFEIYKFADKIDIILMIIGSIAALGAGACYPVMFAIYQRVLNAFVDYNNANLNTTGNITNPCFVVSNNTNTTSPTAAMKSLINYYVILGFVSILCCWIGWTCWITAAERQVRRIRFILFRNILRQEIGWFDVHSAGELSNRLIVNLDKIKDGMGEKVPDFLSLFGRMTGSLIFSLVTGWKLTLVALSLTPLTILIFNVTIKVIVRFTVKEVQAFASASAVAQEVLQNIRTVTAFHGQQKEEERFATSLIDAKTIGIKKGIYLGLCQAFSGLLGYVGFSIIAWYGPYLARTECSNYSAGTVLVIFFGSMTAMVCVAQFLPNVQNFAEAASNGVHIFDIIKRQTQIDASSDEGEKPQTITGHIEFNNVTFTYPARQEAPVLKKLSLQVPSGKTTALVGPSGCGKSTIIQLIQRFYDPDSGQILLDGQNIEKLNVAWLRTHIGIVSQEPVLFTGSIEENIRFGKQDATDEEVIAAAKMANAHDFIMALPQNYKTTSGDKLSGGQKQRVAIARALISNPKILLLDEATSALDNTSERIVQDALDKAKEGRTTIVIAHRLSTIRNADLIIGLERGEVIESGSHDELMERKGLYYELVTAQSQKEEKPDDSDSESEGKEEEEKKVKNDYLMVPKLSIDRRFSRQSIFSFGNSSGRNEDGDELSLNDILNNEKWFHTPFLVKISKFNAPEWYWILLGTIVSFGFGSISPFYGLLFSDMYGAFGEPNVQIQEQITRRTALIALGIGIAAGTAQILMNASFAKSGEALTMRMRKLAFSAMLRQEISYFDDESNSTGVLVTRLSQDASALKGLTGIRIGIILQGISATLVGLILGFTASWKLTLVILAFSPVLLLSSKLQAQERMKNRQSESKNKTSLIEQGGQHAIQAIEQIRTVVALHQENHFINLYEDVFNQEYKKQIRYAHLSALGTALTNSSVYFLQCTCFGYGGTLIAQGDITFKQMYRVFSVVSFGIFAVGRCIAMIPDYTKAKAAALRIMKLHGRVSKIDPNDDSGITPENVVGNIEFHNVDFCYPNRPTLRVLRHFSLKCSTGETTALVGPSGSGKSTTIALLQRFYDPSLGKVLLDGHDIKILNLKWLRSLMGLVQQEPVLFNLSIRDNIAYGDNNQVVTQEQIEDAARKANIHDSIILLPAGYDTLCGSKGSQLSGGQKQRVAIARALIRNPKILLLDEATSALDNKSEKVVQDALEQAQTGRTCLTIAHRLSTIKNSHKIVVMNRGKMVEEGTHDELLKENGIFANLVAIKPRSVHK